ncbi:MAG TPA: hypothetical protein VFP46_01395 [Candidatus Paceibacterota bacterium]|nr:hypothetical protein [Candidatus Paceibacterota bacterium]
MTIKPIWIVIVLVVLGALWYLLPDVQIGTNAPTAATTTATTSETKQSVQTSQTKSVTKPPVKVTAPRMAGVGPLTSLMALQQPLVCSVQTMNGVQRLGTLYLAGGKARLNFSTASMIDDGVTIYVWAKGATTGVKMAATVSSSGSVAASNGGVDPGNNLSYACNPWTEDASVFAPPTGVAF